MLRVLRFLNIGRKIILLEGIERNGLFVKNPAMTVSKTLTQTVGEKSYMCNQVFLQIKPADSVIFNENEEE